MSEKPRGVLGPDGKPFVVPPGASEPHIDLTKVPPAEEIYPAQKDVEGEEEDPQEKE